MEQDKVGTFKLFERESGTPGEAPSCTKEWLANQLEYWKEVEKTTTNPIVQQKATDKITAINAVLDTQ